MSTKPRTHNTVMGRLLTQPDKGMHSVTGTKGVLAYLWRKLLVDTETDPGRWEMLKRKFVQKFGGDAKKTSLGQNTARALSRSEITWASLNRGMVILNGVEAEVTIKMKLRTGREVQASIRYILDVDDPELFEESVDDKHPTKDQTRK